MKTARLEPHGPQCFLRAVYERSDACMTTRPALRNVLEALESFSCNLEQAAYICLKIWWFQSRVASDNLEVIAGTIVYIR